MTTYKDAGVDVEAGEEMVDRIKPLVRKTFTDGVMTDIGAFGAFFKVDWRAFEDPVLVSSVDGVGTKLKVAFAMEQHDTVGQDLVNHCVNDIAVCGATPLFFLDYFSTGKLDQEAGFDVIKGFAKGGYDAYGQIAQAGVHNRCIFALKQANPPNLVRESH